MAKQGTDCHLPVELWLDIFEQLGFPQIKAASLVCKYLRFLALPFMFRHLRLFPDAYPRQYDSDRSLWSNNINRLAFFASDRICHIVRECTITWLGVGLQSTFTVGHLHHFRNLGVLHLKGVTLDDRSLQALQTLPALISLILWHCSIHSLADVSPHLLPRPRHLEMQATTSLGWHLFVNPVQLETLTHHRAILPPWLANQAIPHLRVLRLINCTVPPNYPALLAFSQLEVLELHSSLFVLEVPKLKEFVGSARSLLPVTSGGTIKKLSLPLTEETGAMHRLLREVAPLNPQLQCLTVQLEYLKHDLIEAVCAFSALRDLEISVRGGWALQSHHTIDSHKGLISKLIASTFPPLIHVSDGHRLSRVYYVQTEQEALSCWAAQHARLRYVVIPGYQMYSRGGSDCGFKFHP